MVQRSCRDHGTTVALIAEAVRLICVQRASPAGGSGQASIASADRAATPTNPTSGPAWQPPQALAATHRTVTTRGGSRSLRLISDGSSDGGSVDHMKGSFVRRGRPNASLAAVIRSARSCGGPNGSVGSLGSLPARGRCAQTLADIAAGAAPAVVRGAAASHRACPPATRAALRADPEPLVCWAPPASVAALNMVSDPSAAVRSVAAGSAACPVSGLRRMGADPDPAVREAVASNPATPAWVLGMLAKDDDYSVLRRVAAHHNTPARVIEDLARDAAGGDLLEDIAANPATRPELLEPLVWGACLCRVECSEDECRWNGETAEMIVAAVLSNPSTPPRMVDELCEGSVADGDEHTGAVARAERSAETLRRLARHDNEYVRAAVAGNPNTSDDTLRLLASEPTGVIAAPLASNPNCPPETLADLAAAHNFNAYDLRRVAANRNCPSGTLAGFVTDPQTEPLIKVAAAANPNCAPFALRAAAADPYDSIRAAAAANSATPVEALTVLLTEHEVTDTVRAGFAARALRAPPPTV